MSRCTEAATQSHLAGVPQREQVHRSCHLRQRDGRLGQALAEGRDALCAALPQACRLLQEGGGGGEGRQSGGDAGWRTLHGSRCKRQGGEVAGSGEVAAGDGARGLQGGALRSAVCPTDGPTATPAGPRPAPCAYLRARQSSKVPQVCSGDGGGCRLSAVVVLLREAAGTIGRRARGSRDSRAPRALPTRG